MILPTLILISLILTVAKLVGSVSLSWLLVLLPGFFSIWVYGTVYLALRMAKCMIQSNEVKND
jgi:hypothetical protein